MIFKSLPQVSSLKPHRFTGEHPMFDYEVPQVSDVVRQKIRKASNIVVIGIGGSTLPLKVFLDASELNDRVQIVDTVDPSRWREVRSLENPIYVVVSKSGETLEIKTLMAELVEGRLLDRTMTVTDPLKGSLRKWTEANKLPSLEIPSNIGGRFTNFTVFHRALLENFGFNFDSLLRRAKSVVAELKNDSKELEILFRQSFESKKETMVLWVYGKKLEGFGYWAQQAIAESLGKRSANGERLGVFPVVLKGPQDQHSVLQLLTDGPQRNLLWFFTPRADLKSVSRNLTEPLQDLNHTTGDHILKILADSTYKTFEERLAEPSTVQPISRFEVGTLEELAELIAMIQAYVEYSGRRLGISAFDQPGVERGKQIARELLKSY